MSKILEILDCIKYTGYAPEYLKTPYTYLSNAYSEVQMDQVKLSEALKSSDKIEDNVVERNVDCLLHNIENGHFIKCDVCDVNWHKGCMCCIEHLKNSEEIDTIKQALIQSEKDKIQAERDKRFREIVISKNVDILELKICIEHYSDKVALKRYNSQFGKGLQLTEDEFIFLKEMVK